MQCTHPQKKPGRRLLVFWLVMAAGFSILQSPVSAQGVTAPPGLPHAQASTYVPLDSWVYDAFDRLHALGYADTAYLGLRPWTRSTCRHVLQQTSAGLERTSDAEEARKIFAALNVELAEDDTTTHATVDALYGRWLGTAGEPLTDSAHFGQTIINDYGRPYGRGLNTVDGVIAHAGKGRFALQLRGEYQHAPLRAALPPAALDAIAVADQIPAQPPARSATDNFRLLNAGASFHLLDHEISLGKREDWWGPGKGGSMAWSSNAEPIYALRIDRVEPLYIPLLSRVTGSFRYEAIFGDLKGWNHPREPWVHAQKVSFKPTRDLEFGFSRVVIFAGQGHVPLTFGSFWHSFTSFSNVSATEKFSRKDPGERHSSFDFTWRLPGLTRWVTLYSDSIVHDDTSPVDAPRRSAVNPGLYIARLPAAPHLDLRLEGVNTDTPAGTQNGGHFIYWEGQYRNGYTNKGNLIGSWIGREGKGGQVWMTWWLNPRESVQWGYRNAKVAAGFMPGGTTQNDFSVRATLRLKSDLELIAFAQDETWKAPLLAAGRVNNFTGYAQLMYFPHFRLTR